MKRVLFFCFAVIVSVVTASAQITDTIVSLIPSNRNVLIEEYTGVNCGWCPDGHKKANQIKNSNPGRVSIINIHAGGFAPMYTTQFGTALNNQAGISSYPNGTINRHVFSNNTIQVSDRDKWATFSNQILAMSSPVNIAAEGTIDWLTRTVNIRVQLYYTGAQTVTSNSLNIAVLQDNVFGPQEGAANHYPQMIVDGEYRHMHMLRHLITGQWGEEISDIAEGTLIEKNYEYVIPAQLGTGTAVEAFLEDMRFVAFVCEGHKEVLTAVDVPITIVNRPSLEARLLNVENVIVRSCEANNSGKFKFKNIGSEENITSLKYTYSINQTAFDAEWNGNLDVEAIATVTIPNYDIELNQNYNLSIEITEVNGQPFSATKTTQGKKNVYTNNGYMYFKLVTDRYADETSFKVFAPNGAVVLQGGPFTQLSANGTTVREYDIKPEMAGCYILEVYDTYGDGINANYGAGYFELYGSNDNRLFRDNGKFGSKAMYMIDITEPYSIDEYVNNEAIIYPNPATDNVSIKGVDEISLVEIFNLQGQLVKTESNSNTISIKDLANGVYMMKVTSANGASMHKVVKK